MTYKELIEKKEALELRLDSDNQEAESLYSMLTALGNRIKDAELELSDVLKSLAYLETSLPELCPSKEELLARGFYDIALSLPAGYVTDGSKSYYKEIQAALKKHTKIVWPGFDLLIEDKPLTPQGEINFITLTGGRFVKSPTSIDNYKMVDLGATKNGRWSFSNLKGYIEKGNKGEHGMGYLTLGSENLTLNRCKGSECLGDVFYIGNAKDGTVTKGVRMIQCEGEKSNRNNGSIISAENLTIDGGSFNYAAGTSPEDGIDMESNNNKDEAKNIALNNVSTRGNKQHGIQLHFGGLSINPTTGKKDLTIKKEISVYVRNYKSREDGTCLKISSAGANVSGPITIDKPFFSKYKNGILDLYNFDAKTGVRVVIIDPAIQELNGNQPTDRKIIETLILEGVKQKQFVSFKWTK